MRLSKTLAPIAVLAALAAVPASAQMYPGQGVTVNGRAVQGGQMLIYPGGSYMRVLPPLLEPGQDPSGQAPIHLHMPEPHRVAHIAHHTHVAAAPTTDVTVTPALSNDSSSSQDTTIAPTPAPAPAAPAHKKHTKSAQVAATAPDTAPPPPSDGGMPLQFSDEPATAVPTTPAAPAPAHTKSQTKVASTEPPPAQTGSAPAKAGGGDHANLSKRAAILFEQNATDPSPAQYDGVKLLAGDLNSALEAGAARVQLEAYGGTPGDKSSDARRLSLKRALAVRQLLIDDGVPSSRIDIRAMGGTDDKGPSDRVDVFVRAS
jgi:outer membrane protein OmpA-like peptidoglycan-associated protein